MKTSEDIKEIIISTLKEGNWDKNITDISIGFIPAGGPEEEDFFSIDVTLGSGIFFPPQCMRIQNVYNGKNNLKITMVLSDLRMLLISHEVKESLEQ